MKKFWIPIAAFAVLGILLARGLSLDPRKIPSPLVGKPLPAFSLPTLENPGRKVANTDLRGQVVLINVWASWCAACRQEHPLLMELAQRQVVPVIGLNYKDQRPDAEQMLRTMGNPYGINLVDADGRVGINWGVYGVPETFLIDKAGIIRFKHIGPITRESWERDLAPLIAQLK